MEVNWMHSEQLANELPAFLEAQGEGATVLLADDDLGRTRIEFFPPGKASPLCDDKSFVFVVSMIFRPGSCRFFHELEHTFFPPQSPLNREFSVLHSYWSGMLWMGCRIPVGRLECAHITAKRTGMHISNGVPMVIGAGGASTFPLSGDNVFSLENAHGSKVYDGPAAAEEMLKDEQMELTKETRR